MIDQFSEEYIAVTRKFYTESAQYVYMKPLPPPICILHTRTYLHIDACALARATYMYNLVWEKRQNHPAWQTVWTFCDEFIRVINFLTNICISVLISHSANPSALLPLFSVLRLQYNGYDSNAKIRTDRCTCNPLPLLQNIGRILERLIKNSFHVFFSLSMDKTIILLLCNFHAVIDHSSNSILSQFSIYSFFSGIET